MLCIHLLEKKLSHGLTGLTGSYGPVTVHPGKFCTITVYAVVYVAKLHVVAFYIVRIKKTTAIQQRRK